MCFSKALREQFQRGVGERLHVRRAVVRSGLERPHRAYRAGNSKAGMPGIIAIAVSRRAGSTGFGKRDPGTGDRLHGSLE